MVLKLSHNPTHLSPVRLWHSSSVPSTELLQEVLMGLGLLYAKCEQGSLVCSCSKASVYCILIYIRFFHDDS
jgi:hypothetical protein